VLVLQSHRQSLPINTDWYRGIVRGFASAVGVRVDIEIEALDPVRYSEDDHIPHLLDVYRLKYAGAAPDLIIPTYMPALEFLLQDGGDLFPDALVVFCAADLDFERRARQELRSVGERIELIWPRGLPLEELLEAVQRLPPDTPILYTDCRALPKPQEAALGSGYPDGRMPPTREGRGARDAAARQTRAIQQGA